MQSRLTPSRVADNHDLRSQFMRYLIATPSDVPRSGIDSAPQRLLVQFWDDAKAIPEDVQACLDSWAPLEFAGFDRVLFDDDSARLFIGAHCDNRHLHAFERCHHPAMRADYFRLCFVLRCGGLYVDADDEYQGGGIEPLFGDGRLKLQALCYDTATDSMVDVAQSLKHVAKAERIFYVNNNPLVAAPGHPVIAAALERSTAQLLKADAANRDVQSLTGPGNLTASLVAHAAQLLKDGAAWDFEVLTNWDAVAKSKWPLAYRADARNWRNWVRDEY